MTKGDGRVGHDILCGDALAVLDGMPDASVDALVTDPPAGIAFMGKEWDRPERFPLRERGPCRGVAGSTKQTAHAHERGFANGMHIASTGRARDTFIAGLAAVFTQCRRVVKPGGYALVWALPRTSHWTAMALEEAGFEIRDSIHHLFGSGFPKSKSCLKPAHEVWWLAKAPGPLQPLQIDACRVPRAEIGAPRAYAPRQDREQWGMTGGSTGNGASSPAGRWPSNLVLSHHPDCQPVGVRRVRSNGHYPATRGSGGLGTAGHGGQQDVAECHLDDEAVPSYVCVDGCPIKALDAQAGQRTSGAMKAGTRRADTCGYRGAMPDQTLRDTYGDAGAVSRFFPTFAPEPDEAQWGPFRYVPKASRSEREKGLEGAVSRTKAIYGASITSADHPGTADGGGPRPARNHHPTVKPVALMRWLVRLVTPPGGERPSIVLDPFAGTATTGVACVYEGLSFVGIEAQTEYVEIARCRLAHAREQQAGPLFAGLAGRE